MSRQKILLVMEEPHLLRLYTRLLERRGHAPFVVGNLADASEWLCHDPPDLMVVDADVAASFETLRDWLDTRPTTPGGPPLILLDDQPVDGAGMPRFEPRLVDLTLHKPLSPVELGIQVDQLLEDSSLRSLEEESVVEREVDATQREFLLQLDEDLQHIDELWAQLVDSGEGRPLLAASLRRTLNAVKGAAHQFGFTEISDVMAKLAISVRPLLDPDSQVPADTFKDGLALIHELKTRCQDLQSRHPAMATFHHQSSRPQTILVVDPDLQFLGAMQRFGEHFMLRVRTATSLDEALRRVQTPLLTGVMLSVACAPSAPSLREAIEALRMTSPLERLPVALIGEDGQDLDRIRSLWAGTSVMANKPITASTFARTAARLAELRSAQKASILLVEPHEDFASFIAEHLDTPKIAVHHYQTPIAIFEKLERHRPDLVMLSTHALGVSSFDICRALRAIPRWRPVPIVMIAEEDDDATRLAAYRAGADDFFARTIGPEELAARVEIRLDRIQMLRDRADRDALTGLLTRRAFLEQLAGRLSEAERHHRRLTFVLIDIDRFKSINDRFGHPAGDRVLEALGQLLQDCFRIEDLRARWGGEEFAIVLVDEATPTAQQALQRVLRKFSSMTFTGPNDEEFSVTFSAGIAEFPDDGRDPETLLGAADARLLQAKRRGRNTIVIAGAL